MRLKGGNQSDTVMFLFPGTRYGKWTVIQDAAVRSTNGLKSRVRCVCGDVFLVRNGDLRNGHSKSCKRCSYRSRSDRKPIVPGTRFGRWTVLEDLGAHARHSYSRCQCDCGRVFSVINLSLKSGTSAGCRFCARGSKPDWRGIKARAEGER